ncbi:[acyl-carrier-protein] S-malonyltransferase [bacterium (Candidatus Blackallbacteria) CG17_big_fil_post_rev_8_21_14_2_50_48_46]|uniref:Malonyl CoA-acyl carrier protein transacylase n=1 Tax=bacterium (Candidatus Blackallbacteria) CG17_big_fil_post_rev_8_21_14_2_50_48_46 TaxID=2014261 RepID=A0A2M7G8X7_9BACT|nr:MAG: [acyl-carrier-protein] S-malonyltransferase [bacterium (Candidatus Blackallbacteria) CG18_big_fil_WC_8_21_14_2_50_49_26]PIW18572.1 MAG: [acyl-carrier-protein] S-malonyltransferase [bacterium (Candidatus Blackallbacteria) CG17_big_fil_post_rev_8_21_14_2_50_48_46]PIW46443.1 MAG: [acyl-carrier-protein] S-malonyltransferase [bacterium (Candidatus Blackallbacteria) CG13_big_fil_rev_8_21_14_2_50_49_14]
MNSIPPFCLVFPGQGSQALGMGQSYSKFPVYQQIMAQSEAILGFPFKQILAEGPLETLTRTEFAQPALFAVGYGIFKVLETEFDVLPQAVAGHSLGEYTALAAAEVLGFEAALQLVALRGQLMQAACEQNPGAMVAVVKAELPQIETLLADPRWQNQVGIGNYNSPGQCVLSGEKAALEALAAEIRMQKWGRAVPLKVSGAFHSPLMSEAQKRLSQAIEALSFQPARFPVVTNLDGEMTTEPEAFRQKLLTHLLSPVRWEASVRSLAQFSSLMLEAGPGSVLSGLIRQTLPDVQTHSLAEANLLTELNFSEASHV